MIAVGARPPKEDAASSLKHSVQGYVGAELVIPTCKATWRGCQTCKLACDIQRPAQSGEISLILDVLTRKAAMDCPKQLAGKQANQPLKQIALLRFDRSASANTHGEVKNSR